MDEFCGDVRNSWGVSAKGYLTHCFDDLVLFGVTYIFICVAGSYRCERSSAHIALVSYTEMMVPLRARTCLEFWLYC